MFSRGLSLVVQRQTGSICRHLSVSQMLNAQKVAVIGAGLMGSGIAQVAAQSGYEVTMVDTSDVVLSKSTKAIEASLQRVAKKKFKDSPEDGTAFVNKTLANLSTQTNPATAASTASIVIEAVVENLELKHKLYKDMEAAASSDTIFATNTSSLKLSDMATVLKRKDKFGGTHFFNPVPVMKLVEIVRGNDTSEETFNALTEFGQKLGKTTVSCKDTNGFIVNRLLVPYQLEAIRLLERGDASVKDIDIAMKLGAGYPMGPFELCDYVGLDTVKFILDIFHKAEPENPLMKPIPMLNKMVAEGKFGRKSGEGFYKY